MGDSRLYLHRAGQLTLLTRDHTQVQWLVDSNEIDEEGARSHPDASVLTRALGHGSGAVIDVSEPIPLGDGDGILLCSDGLSGFASSQEIDRTIKQFPEAADCVRELIRLALDRGSNDNVTVQFLRVGNQPAPIVPAPKQKRKTLPEGPVITAAPPQYYHPPPSTTVNRGPLFAGAAIGLVLVAGGVFVFRDKPLPGAQNRSAGGFDGNDHRPTPRRSLADFGGCQRRRARRQDVSAGAERRTRKRSRKRPNQK